MDELKIKSSGSTIEINDKGQKILVSEYKAENVKLQSRMDMTRYYLGTPYFGDQWYTGTMSFKGGSPVKGIMAYNLVSNSLYYSLNENIEAIEVDPDQFTLGETTFQKLDHLYKGTAGFYYEVLFDGEPKLLKQHTGNYIQEQEAGQSGYGANPNGNYEGSFEKGQKYYIVIQKQLSLVRNRKSFYKNLGPYSDKAMDFKNENDLDMRIESDLFQLIEFLAEM